MTKFRFAPILAIFFSLIIALVAWLSLSGPDIPTPPKKQQFKTILPAPTGPWSGFDSTIEIVREALWNAQDAGFITADDFEYLDFKSGDFAHGWNPKYIGKLNIFSKRYYIAGPDLEPDLKKEVMNLVEAGKESEPFVTLRRYKFGRRGDLDYLYLVIPYIAQSKCGKIEKPETKITISADTKEILTDPRVLRGCVYSTDGTLTLFVPILWRMRISEVGKWEMQPRRLAL